MTSFRMCTIEGCGKPHLARGWCGAHYSRWQRHGDPIGGRTPVGEPLAFLDAALTAETDECVAWTFARDRKGYGTISIDGATRSAHRIICERAHGAPPTPEHHAAHSCGNGHLACINKRHLSWKTCVENHADKISNGTDNRGDRNPRSKLNEADVLAIRRLRGTALQRDIAARFGVSTGTISDVQLRKSWAWLDASEARAAS